MFAGYTNNVPAEKLDSSVKIYRSVIVYYFIMVYLDDILIHIKNIDQHYIKAMMFDFLDV